VELLTALLNGPLGRLSQITCSASLGFFCALKRFA